MSDHEYKLNIYQGEINLMDIDDDSDNSDDSKDNKDNDCEIIITNIYPLKYTWILYDHIKSDNESYDLNMRNICEINDVIKFWQIFNNYPMPSKLFNNGIHRPLMNSREISSLSIFKKGILPKWEDSVNMYGAEISKRKFNKKNPLEELDKDWINLLMLCLGSNINGITGLRVVDSSSFKKNDSTGLLDFKLLYRIELWFDNCSDRVIMEEHFKTILNIDDSRLINYKEHHTV
jgi:hypothetical protein